MKDKLSVIQPDEITLETNQADRAASFLKAVAGAAPVVGSLVTELITVTIPNQKQDRIIAFLKVLNDKVRYIEKDVLRQKMKGDGFTSLLEDALRQASRSLSPERRKYLAALLKNSLSKDEVDQIGQKELLELLSELNDAEIIVLKYEALGGDEKIVEAREFAEKNRNVLVRLLYQHDEQRNLISSPTQDEYDRDAMLHRYYTSLIDSRVLQKKEFYFDGSTYEVTSLGMLLLRYIDLT